MGFCNDLKQNTWFAFNLLFCWAGFYDCVKKLLAHGAYFSIKDNNGRIPYENSISYRKPKIEINFNHYQQKSHQNHLFSFIRLDYPNISALLREAKLRNDTGNHANIG